MLTLKDVEEYWSKYSLGLDALARAEDPVAAYQEIKDNHDKAYGYANSLLDLPSLRGKSVLELGCGIGLDTIEFAKHCAYLTAIDLSINCIDIARKYGDYQRLKAGFLVCNAEELCFPDDTFDVVIARGLLMYTPNPMRVIDEIFRVLKYNGKAVFLLHHKYSWYVLVTKIGRKKLYNDEKDPPINYLYTVAETKRTLEKFRSVKVFLDRLPTKSVNRKGPSAVLYNVLFLPLAKMIPSAVMRHFGYYIIAECSR